MPQPVPLRFKVDDYYKMIELGMLEDYEKAEIINGELIRKMPIGDKHLTVVNYLSRILIKNISDSILVSIQNPVRLTDYHEPQPDVVLADLTKFDGKRKPNADEVLLLIEVSDSTLEYDRNKKLPLYAEAGISEVWLVNLQNDTVEQHLQPKGNVYSLIKVLRRGESVKSENVAGLEIEIDKILD
jgi:Uma2 family endonuclease